MSGKLSVVRPLLLPARIAGLMRLGVKITVVRPLLFKQPKKYYGHDPSSCAGFRLFYGCEAHWMAIYEFTQWLLRTAVAVTNREIIRGASPVIQTNNCTTPEVARIKMQTHSTGAGFQSFYGCEARWTVFYEFKPQFMGIGELSVVRRLFTEERQ